jgi:hypothetical protein
LNLTDIPWQFLNLELPDLAEAWAREVGRRLPGLTDEPWAIALAMQGKVDAALQIAADGLGEEDRSRRATFGAIQAQEGKDFSRALTALEYGLTPPGSSEPQIESNGDINWSAWTNYTLALQRTGNEDRVVVTNGWSIDFLLATFHAQAGDDQQALARLERTMNAGLALCARCLRNSATFDTLRGRPRFEALVTRVDDERAAQRRKLADEGLLLTPDAVMALEDYQFDPFERRLE